MPGATLVRALASALRDGRAVATVSVLAADARAELEPGTRLLVPEDPGEAPLGTTGDAALDDELAREARSLLARGATERHSVAGVDAFFRSFVSPPVLHVIGAVHPAAELAAAAKLAGFRVVVCDPRSPFATPERLPAADEIVREWPDEHLSRAGLGARDAVAILTHDLKFDAPAIRVALREGAGYVGAMGSRKTHERRIARLREEGVTDEELTRVSAPIGLDIGARTPGEIAIAIVAEIVSTRRRR